MAEVKLASLARFFLLIHYSTQILSETTTKQANKISLATTSLPGAKQEWDFILQAGLVPVLAKSGRLQESMNSRNVSNFWLEKTKIALCLPQICLCCFFPILTASVVQVQRYTYMLSALQTLRMGEICQNNIESYEKAAGAASLDALARLHSQLRGYQINGHPGSHGGKTLQRIKKPGFLLGTENRYFIWELLLLSKGKRWSQHGYSSTKLLVTLILGSNIALLPFLCERVTRLHKWQTQNLHKLVLQDRETSDNFKMTKAGEKAFFPYSEFKLISSTTNHSKAQASQFLSVMSSI